VSGSSGWRLVVAEKPSVARDIARVLGVRGGGRGIIGTGNVRVSWCLGHLVELEEPGAYNEAWRAWRLESLPMLPVAFALKPRKGSVDQWKIVSALLKDRGLTEVVNACDAGREGELIFAYAYDLAGCTAPVRRLWISSMTDAAITQGFKSLQPGAKFNNLADAARCRSEADWLVGLNATRAMTTRMRAGGGGGLLSIGRVQTPTLSLIDAREAEIEGFVPRDFWELRIRFKALPDAPCPPAAAEQEWDAVWEGLDQPPKDVKDASAGKVDKRIWDHARATALLARISERPAEVADVKRKTVNERPPLLYDLTTLQKEGNRRWRFSAQKTLDIAQELYERYKVLTYPRTDSRHLASAQIPTLPGLVKALAFGPYLQTSADIQGRWPVKLTRRVVDDNEVSDHHAIIPTGVDPRPLGLKPDEKRIFDLVSRRFLAVFMPDAVFATVVIDTQVAASDDTSERFLARGRSCLDVGWQAIDPPRRKRRETLLPPVVKGVKAEQVRSALHQGQTQPPRRYNEASLLSAMERAGEAVDDAELKRAMKRNGLGTPATRAAIIETLIRRQFIERQAANLVPTEQGRVLLRALPVESMRSPALTGAWEARLVAMAEGREERGAFMADIRAFTSEIVETIRSAPVPSDLGRIMAAAEATGAVLAPCPRCKGELREGRRGWGCGGCGLRIPDQVARREVSVRMARQLASTGTTKVVKGFKARSGKTFSAALKLDMAEGKVSFDFPEPDALGDCPACGTSVRHRGKVYTCETGRECAFVVFAEMSGREIPEEAVVALLRDGQSTFLTGFSTRDGEPFDGVLRWMGDRVRSVAVDARELEAPAGACTRCHKGTVAFARNRWRCDECELKLAGKMAGRPLRREEVAALLTAGRTKRLHGFRQQSGAVFKAALVLNADGSLAFDYSKPADEQPEPPPLGGPPPAFGARMDCPLCVNRAETDPGYVIAGRAAWGCSAWRTGCKLRIPFEVEGRRLTDDEVQRLFTKHKATRYLKGFKLPDGKPRKTCRVALQLENEPCWTVEERGGARK